MLFNSLYFLIFFPIVVLAYFAIPVKTKHFWVLVASYYFYMCWNAKYALLILTSTAVTYIRGFLMEGIKHKNTAEVRKVKLKKGVVAFSSKMKPELKELKNS